MEHGRVPSAVINESDNVTAPYLEAGTVTSGLLATAGVTLKFAQATSAQSYLITVSIDLVLEW